MASLRCLSSFSLSLHTPVAPVSCYYSTGTLFNHRLLDSPEGFDLLTQTTLSESQRLARAIVTDGSTSREKILSLFDQLSDTLCRGADLAECVRLLHPDPSYARKAEECCAVIGSYVEQLNTDPSLYVSLKRMNYGGLEEASRRHAETLLRDFEISGIHLSVGKRKEFVKLYQQILNLSHTFVNQSNLPTCIKSPPQIIKDNKQLFRTNKNNEVYIDSVPYSSPDSLLKEYCYKSYYSPDHPNSTVLDSLLQTRYQLAQLVGYDSFARRSLVGSMAGTPEIAMEFLEALNERIQPLALQEVDDMISIRNISDGLKPWDYPMIFEQARQKLFKTSTNLRNYFTLPSCISGLQCLVASLFDVQVELSHPLPGEAWHPSVSKFRFIRKGQHLGDLYCDWFNREGKMASDCQFTIQGGRNLHDGTYQLPISTLSLSLSYGDPPLMTPQSVVTLFHEMGHALHSILGRSPYQNTSGTRCSTDFAEVPSNLMELFLKDSRVLNSFAKHYQTKKELSSNAMMEFKYSSHLFPAFITQEQILHSVMDQSFHGPSIGTKSTLEIFSNLHEKYSVMDYVPDTAWYLRFTHLYTYAGKYYSYLWARSVANLIWNKCFRDDPYSRIKGQLYESAMLSAGGGADPWDLVQHILGYRPSIRDLVDAYYHEIVTMKEQIDKNEITTPIH